MHAEFSYAHFEWSFFAIYCYFHNENIRFVELNLSRVLGKKWHFCLMGLQGAPLCAHTVFVPGFQCHPLKRHRPAPNCTNSLISQYSAEYEQWITTQNVRKKILHALHFKWTILIKYFLSYIKKCQMGTYFFSWVYNTSLLGASHLTYCQLRARRALLLFKDDLLRTRRALSPYTLYSNSALLVLNGTSLNIDSALLALNWRYSH